MAGQKVAVLAGTTTEEDLRRAFVASKVDAEIRLMQDSSGRPGRRRKGHRRRLFRRSRHPHLPAAERRQAVEQPGACRHLLVGRTLCPCDETRGRGLQAGGRCAAEPDLSLRRNCEAFRGDLRTGAVRRPCCWGYSRRRRCRNSFQGADDEDPDPRAVRRVLAGRLPDGRERGDAGAACRAAGGDRGLGRGKPRAPEAVRPADDRRPAALRHGRRAQCREAGAAPHQQSVGHFRRLSRRHARRPHRRHGGRPGRAGRQVPPLQDQPEALGRQDRGRRITRTSPTRRTPTTTS